MNWFIGTMGFAYKDWKGPFYPADLETEDYLAFYSRAYNAVEIDSTFYGTPRADVVRRWSAVTPDGFVFCAKLPKVITHEMGLVGAAGLLAEFTDTMRLLEEKLGVLLIQLPPSFTRESLPALEEFLAGLPGDLRFAVEFRHRSWYTAEAETASMLRENRVCWAATEYPHLPARVIPIREYLYIRWIGQHGTFEHHDQERIDRSTELQRWWAELQHLADRIESVYGFFNNDYAGHAPATADRFKELAGLPVARPRPPKQLDFLGDL